MKRLKPMFIRLIPSRRHLEYKSTKAGNNHAIMHRKQLFDMSDNSKHDTKIRTSHWITKSFPDKCLKISFILPRILGINDFVYA